VPKLFIFVNAQSSCSCLDDWENWVLIHEKHTPDLLIIGVVNGSSFEKTLRFWQDLSLPFPLIASEALLASYRVPPGITSKILVDAGNHQIYGDTLQRDFEDQRYFIERLASHLETNQE
jgi:hypothetical protein